MHPFRHFSFSLVSAIALSAQGTPPAAGDEPVALDHFVTTAHPYGRSQAEIAHPTNVLAGSALALRQASSLGEVLAGEPGVASTYFGPGASRPIVRGLGGDRLRVLENGTATLDASAISPDHAVAFDPLLIERVEVVRGPATLLHGNTAVGGVVNVITHRIHAASPESEVNGRAEARYNSVNDERSAGFVLEGGQGSLAWHVDAYAREANDVRIPGFARPAFLRDEEHEDAEDHDDEADHKDDEERPGRIPNTALTADGAALGLSWIGERGYVGFSFAGHNSLYGIPAGAHAHHAAHEEEHGESSHDETHAEEGGESVRIDLRQRRFDLQGEWRNPLAGVNALRYTFGHARYRHLELEGGEIGTIYANRGNDVRLEALLAPLGAFEGAFGVQASRSRLDATGEEAFVPPSDTRNRAAFLFEEAVLGPVRWQFGARLEEQRIRLRDDTGIRRKDTTAGLSSGAVWDFGDGWSLGASVSRSERAPTAQELFSDGPHLGTNAYEVGNPGLDAETSLAVDLSLRRRAGRITGALTVFEHRFDGYIYETPTGEEEDELDVYAYVQRDARFRGAEVETVIHLHEGERHRLDVHVAGDFVHGRDRDSGQDLPRMTPRRARLGAVWTNGIWTLGGEAQRVSSQRRVASAETASSGYTLLGAHANLRFTAGRSTFDLFVRGNNLTDREARVHTSFLKDVAPLPGRNVTIGVRTSF